MESEHGQTIKSFSNLTDALNSLDGLETVLVTRKTGIAALEADGLMDSFKIVVAPEGEPELEDVLGLESISLNGVRRIVSLGGGSVIDFGKGMLAIADFPELRGRMANTTPSSYSIGLANSTIEHIAIPTRAGSGSEASSSAIFRMGSKKVPIFGPALVPSSIFWVPSLLDKNPQANLVGILDMLGHAVESLLSTRSNSILDMAALDVIALSIDLGVKSEFDAWDSLRLLKASYSAGVCQDLRLVSLPHALAHNFANDFPHGLMVGNFLIQFLSRLSESRLEDYEFLLNLFSNHNISFLSFLNLLDKWVKEVNSMSEVSSFEHIRFEDARKAMEDPAARLTRFSLDEDSFSRFEFQRPVRSQKIG